MSRPAPDLHDIAADWFMRSRAPGWGDRDAAELDAWLADPEHRACFGDVAEAWQASAAAAATPGVQALRAQALAARPPRAGPAPWMRLAAAFAAVVVLVAGAGAGALYIVRAPPEVQVYRTGVGERATVSLADGSQATLNTASALAVEYTRSRRGLRLLAGEAWFDVAKIPNRPFVVVAAGHSVTATGTSFDVRLDPDRLRVAVSEGRVLVATADRRPLAAVAAGQRAEVRGGAVLVAHAAPIGGDWRSGRLQFDAVTLAEASAELNRYRRTPIVIDDPAAAGLRVSGVFEAGEGSSFVDALPLTHPVVVTRTPEAVRIASRHGGKNLSAR